MVNDREALCIRNDRDLPTHCRSTRAVTYHQSTNERAAGKQANDTGWRSSTTYRGIGAQARRWPPNKPHYSVVTPKSWPTLRQTWPRLETSAAMCVRDVDDQGVLQFTLLHAVCCALHRRTSRVIHRLELYFNIPYSIRFH